MTTVRSAAADPALHARVVRRAPLYYGDGADASLDRPAHVRAGSSLTLIGDRLALIQDDANFVAMVDPTGPRVGAITLPAGEGGARQFDDRRGNKALKLDLEAGVAVPHGRGTLLVAFGSGSSPRREQIVAVGGWGADEPAVTVWAAPRFYERLRRQASFAGSELNVEGAVHLGECIRLFGRGNGAWRGGLRPLNATCDVDWPALLAHLRRPDREPPPPPTNVTQYELGALDGVPLGFTDAARWGDAILFSAAAEESPNTVLDGRVVGSALGVIGPDGRTRWTALADASGAPFAGKVEGIAVDDHAARETAGREAAARVFAVMDADDPAAPSELCVVELSGPWGA